ncbi:MFS transporter [Nocardia sp. JMUB6875]|uniref:MFS transporter n=1 Tax=Nocardia sp. JMUB6875 TaxID=3158170 RepID=UPI0032E59448
MASQQVTGLSERRAVVLGTCCAATLMGNLDSTALNVALPSIGRDLRASVSGTQWTIDAYTVTIACLLMAAGSQGDRVGRRRLFQVGLVVFALGSLACSLAPTLGWLVGFRVLQAVGGALLVPLALSILQNVFPRPAEKARALGVWSATTGISMAVGPVVGGLLVDSVGWRGVFWINLPIAAAAFALTALFVPESRSETPRRVDVVGQLLMIGLLGMLVFAIIEGPHRGWLSPVPIGCFLGAAACLILLPRYELRHPEPLIDVRAFRSPPFSGAVIIAICSYAVLGGFLFLNTFYLQAVRGARPAVAGFELLPMAAAMMVAGLLGGRAVARFGVRPALATGAGLAIAGCVLLTFTFDSGGDAALYLGYALVGAGVGASNPAVTDIAVSGLPRKESGVASAIASTSRQIGQSLGVAVIGTILAVPAGALTTAAGFHTPAVVSWVTLTAFAVVALVAALITTDARSRKKARKVLAALT